MVLPALTGEEVPSLNCCNLICLGWADIHGRPVLSEEKGRRVDGGEGRGKTGRREGQKGN